MTFKRTVMMGVAVLALMGASSANAQMATFDASNAANTLATVNQLKNQALQLKQQYDKMQEQLGIAQDAYNAISHLPDTALNQLAAEFNVDEIRDALGDVDQLRDVLNGGDIGDLGAKAREFLEKNRKYTPTGTDQGATDLDVNAKSIAGSQAAASALYDSASKHVEALQAIEGQLATAKDAKQVADITARLQAENAYLQAQQVQAQSLAMMQEAQARSVEQQKAEARRKSLDDAITATRQRIGQ